MVDPVVYSDLLIESLLELDLNVERIIHTNEHLDHFLASRKLK